MIQIHSVVDDGDDRTRPIAQRPGRLDVGMRVYHPPIDSCLLEMPLLWESLALASFADELRMAQLDRLLLQEALGYVEDSQAGVLGSLHKIGVARIVQLARDAQIVSFQDLPAGARLLVVVEFDEEVLSVDDRLSGLRIDENTPRKFDFRLFFENRARVVAQGAAPTAHFRVQDLHARFAKLDRQLKLSEDTPRLGRERRGFQRLHTYEITASAGAHHHMLITRGERMPLAVLASVAKRQHDLTSCG
jgi:hypothetical protein